MHLRLPIVAGVVALAACGALLRVHRPTDVPSFATHAGTEVPAPSPSPPTTRADAAAELTAASGRRPARESRSVSARGATIVVYVAGDVAHAGLYTLPERSRAADAVRAAGGAGPSADLVAIDLAAPLDDGDEVAVSALDREDPSPARRRKHRRASSTAGIAAGGATARSSHHRKKKRAHRRRSAVDAAPGDPAGAFGGDGPTEVVDLNSADSTELETLPGIGATLAQRIVAFREASGPFASPDDLLDVGGMTQGKLDTVLPFVVVR